MLDFFLSDFFLFASALSAGVLISAPIAFGLGKIVARREMADELRNNFRLVKNKKRSNVYEFPLGKNL